MTALELAEMLERCDREMMPGRWTVKHDTFHHPMASEPSDVYTVLDGDGMWVADCGADKGSADSIAAIRNALPALAQCMRGIVEENERLADSTCARHADQKHDAALRGAAADCEGGK